MKIEEFERVYGSVDRVHWIKRLPSIVSGRAPCENVHVKSGGMGRKADACWIIPLTSWEHRDLHQHGPTKFFEIYGRVIDLEAAAVETERRWQEHLAKGDEL